MNLFEMYFAVIIIIIVITVIIITIIIIAIHIGVTKDLFKIKCLESQYKYDVF